MVAFASAADAVRFSLSVQTRLFELSWPPEIDSVYRGLGYAAGTATSANAPEYAKLWNGVRVRIGMHTGECEARLDPVTQGYDYYGSVVNCAARVESIGNGGQILLTDSTLEAIRTTGCSTSSSIGYAELFYLLDAVVVDLGANPLKGIPLPVHLFLLTPIGLAGRELRPLRLDPDCVVETCSTADDQAWDLMSVTCSSSNPVEVVERMVRRRRGRVEMVQKVLSNFHFWEVLTSTTPEEWRREAVNYLKDRWRLTTPAGCAAGELVDVLALICIATFAEQQQRLLDSAGCLGIESAGGMVGSRPTSPLSTMSSRSGGMKVDLPNLIVPDDDGSRTSGRSSN